MKSSPIIFSGLMVRAILEGRKTQTRRVMKKQPSEFFSHSAVEMYSPSVEDKDGFLEAGQEIFGCYDRNGEDEGYKFPYGRLGDRLWVRETHWRHGYWSHPCDDRRKFVPTAAQPVYQLDRLGYEDYKSPRDRTTRAWYKRPSIFMPRWASRITLEITGVRVERLQEISESDSKDEGVGCWREGEFPQWDGDPDEYRKRYRMLWDSINGKGAWEQNPWVWCISFQRKLLAK